MDHTLLIGGDYYNYDYLEINRYFEGPPFVTGPINIFNPIYGTVLEGFKSPQIPPTGTWGARQDWYGLYLQDQIAIGEHWHLLAGFRYDDVKTTQLRGFPTGKLFSVEASEFSPRVGLLYRPASWLSLFGSYTEGFNVPTFSEAAQPQLSRQYEAGLKTEFFEGRLTGTLAYYHLTKTNIQTPTGIPNVFESSGEVRNQGVELDISGSLWTTYDFGGLGLPGLTAGAGAYFIGQRQGDNANTFQVPGYGRVDLMLGYSRKIGPTRATVQFNIENLADKEYFVSAGNRNNILPGAPRTFLGQVRLEY